MSEGLKDWPPAFTAGDSFPRSTKEGQQDQKIATKPQRPSEKEHVSEPPDYVVKTNNLQISPLLALPRELRDQCLLPQLLINNPHPGSPPPLQPLIAEVCRQLRYEALETFYGTNTFRFQLDFTTLLAKCRVWLERIGDANVKLLKQVELVGWRRIPFGHMFRRLKIVLLVDMRTGKVESREEGRLEVEDFKRVMERIKVGWEKGWDVERLGAVMEAFWSGCADNF